MSDFSEEILDAFLRDDSKIVDADIDWRRHEYRTNFYEFEVMIAGDTGSFWRLCANYNHPTKNVNFSIVHPKEGRVYSLGLGHVHTDPEGNAFGSPHKHKWTSDYGDKSAYEPNDITAQYHEVKKLWEEFCAEIKLTHVGEFGEMPPHQEVLL